MSMNLRSAGPLAAASLLTLLATTLANAADAAATTDIAAELQSLKARIAELEAKQNETWLTEDRAAQIRAIVQDALRDAASQRQLADGPDFGYKDGFFIQSPDQNFKLTLGGYIQVRYEFEQANATNGRTFPPRTLGSGSSATTTTPHDPGDASGISLRRARINLAGNVFTPDVTFKLEGDFYGGSAGAFTVTDAWVGYRFSDLFKLRAGAYKVPFAKAELTPDPLATTPERSEVLSPFDPVRALGVSLYGEIVKDQLGYEVAVNNGSQTNTLRRPDTVSASPNLDNRLGFYARVQWAGNGKLADFQEESDRRKDPHDFIWMLGAAAGYESQNATNNAFPSPQTTGTTGGLSNRDGPGFTSYTLNGDLFRATLDWSAKWNGFAFLTAAYFQQVNANPGNTSSTSATAIATGPFGTSDASFFEHAYYGQVSYFVIPQQLELVARAGVLLTEGYPNMGEVYTVGANYYIYGHNLKLQSDITYTPEAPFTDSASGLLQNTHDILGRVQLQLKF